MGRLSTTVQHLLAAGGIFALWWPFFHLYYFFRPALGIDLYLSVSLLTYITEHSPFPWDGWKYIWYGGTPLVTTYPILGFWLMAPLKAFFSNVQTVQVFTLGAMFVFLFLVYLLVRHLSKSTIVGVVAAGAVSMSFNLYGGLFWGGSMPYMQTLWALPLSLLLALKTLETGRRRYLAIAATATGLASLIHPLSVVAYTIPLTVWLLLLWKDERVKMFAREKLGHLLLYLGGIFFVGYPQFAANTSGGPLNVLLTTIRGLVSGSQQVIEQARGTNLKAVQEVAGLPAWQLPSAYIWTNRALVVGAIALIVLFLVSLLLKRARKSWRRPLIFTLWFLYFPAFLFTFVWGFNPFSGGWFRVFWAVPVGFAVLLGAYWGGVRDNVRSMFDRLRDRSRSMRWSLAIAGTVLTAVVGAVGVYGIRSDAPRQVKKMLDFQQISSAFPVDLAEKLSRQEWPSQLRSLAPAWLPVDDVSYRFYSGDATITIWWNSLFDMPQARGYLDSVWGGNYAGWQYLQNVALGKNELIDRLRYPSDLAKNTAEFVLDWHAIKYAEHGSGFGRNYPTELSYYLRDDFARREELTFHERARTFVQEGIHWQVGAYDEKLDYVEFKDAVTSPIFQATSAPAIGIVSSKSGQDTLMRLFAALNRNSRTLIPAYLGEDPSKLRREDFDRFDAVMLYDYHLNPRDRETTYATLTGYVQAGGKLFLDTGTDLPDANATTLPEPMPFEASRRQPMGQVWSLAAGPSPIASGIDLSSFAAPIFDGQPWSVTTPVDALRSGSTVVLSNAGKPVIVERTVGNGAVVWSGLNLPYHILQYVAPAEFTLWSNLLDALVGPATDGTQPTNFTRPKPELVRISGQGATGVLFKEARFPGWSATLTVDGKKIRPVLDEVGPQDPGYMYVRLPADASGKPFTAEFRYRGIPSYWIQWIIAALSVILFVMYLVAPSVVRRVGAAVRHRMRTWWNREEE